MDRRRFVTATAGGAAALLSLLALPTAARADAQLALAFADHMVLQREMRTPIWGTASPNEEVTVSIDGQVVQTRADRDGRWIVRLNPMKAGGPHELIVQGRNTIRLKDILVGDVWICSGQSNMEWPMTRTNNAQKEIAEANNPNIRLCFVPKTVAAQPRTAVNIRWTTCTPETVAGFSAVGYFFGRHLQKSLDVPIGLVNTNWGGTPAEAWTDDETLRSDPDYAAILKRAEDAPATYKANLAKYEEDRAKWQAAVDAAKAEGKPAPPQPRAPTPPERNPNLASVLFNGMIHPLLPMGIKGAIWYQGESNAGRAYQYRKLLPDMIQGWRTAWGQGDFPFLIVQLANYGQNNPNPPGTAWAELREAQAMTAQTVKNSGLAVTIDIGNPEDIHPTNKQDVGRRLGLIAENRVYGKKDVVYSGPVYKSMSVEGDAIRLRFDHIQGGLEVKGTILRGFTIAGPDQKFVPAEAQVDGNTVVVRAAGVTNPVAVRYGWANSPICNLYNAARLPAVPFRTDDWPGFTVNAK
jgi:Domain of unknown function (DUF303).